MITNFKDSLMTNYNFLFIIITILVTNNFYFCKLISKLDTKIDHYLEVILILSIIFKILYITLIL